jgi:multidrug efflux pump subunit AcrA (membrane-fusion protein)
MARDRLRGGPGELGDAEGSIRRPDSTLPMTPIGVRPAGSPTRDDSQADLRQPPRRMPQPVGSPGDLPGDDSWQSTRRAPRPKAPPGDLPGDDSWQSTRRAPRPVASPANLQPGNGRPAPGDQPRLVAQPEPITAGSGARIGLRAVVIALTIVAVLAAGGYGVYVYLKVPPLTDLSAQVVTNGQLDLGFTQTGTLGQILVHSGEHVAAGTVLADETVAGLAQEVAADRQAVSIDQGLIRNVNQLLANVSVETPVVLASTSAALEVDLANDKAQLLRDKANLGTAQALAAAAQIKAPAAGTVLSVSGQVGEVVSGTGVAGSGATGGAVTVTPKFQLSPSQQSVAGAASASPIVVLALGGPVYVNVIVPESQIRLVRMDSRVTITPSVSGIGPVSGTVTQIFSDSVVAAGVVSYEVQVQVAPHGAARDLLPGMTATATIGR